MPPWPVLRVSIDLRPAVRRFDITGRLWVRRSLHVRRTLPGRQVKRGDLVIIPWARASPTACCTLASEHAASYLSLRNHPGEQRSGPMRSTSTKPPAVPLGGLQVSVRGRQGCHPCAVPLLGTTRHPITTDPGCAAVLRAAQSVLRNAPRTCRPA